MTRTDIRDLFQKPWPDCPFCAIVAGEAEATSIADGVQNIGIIPLDPVADGHFLVIPKVHVADAYENPRISAAAMDDAVMWAKLFSDRDSRYASVNIITSVGTPATQTVRHLHLHVVPRSEGDGLPLPWTPQQERQ